MNYKDIWTRIENGDHITDEELEAAIQQAQAAEPYLKARGLKYQLVSVDTVKLLIELRSYQTHRYSKKSQNE